MLKRTLNDVAAPIPAAHAKVTVVIVLTTIGSTKNFPVVYSQKMLRRPLIGLLSIL